MLKYVDTLYFLYEPPSCPPNSRVDFYFGNNINDDYKRIYNLIILVRLIKQLKSLRFSEELLRSTKWLKSPRTSSQALLKWQFPKRIWSEVTCRKFATLNEKAQRNVNNEALACSHFIKEVWTFEDFKSHSGLIQNQQRPDFENSLSIPSNHAYENRNNPTEEKIFCGCPRLVITYINIIILPAIPWVSAATEKKLFCEKNEHSTKFYEIMTKHENMNYKKLTGTSLASRVSCLPQKNLEKLKQKKKICRDELLKFRSQSCAPVNYFACHETMYFSEFYYAAYC